jgi:hypothetical protein
VFCSPLKTLWQWKRISWNGAIASSFIKRGMKDCRPGYSIACDTVFKEIRSCFHRDLTGFGWEKADKLLLIGAKKGSRWFRSELEKQTERSVAVIGKREHLRFDPWKSKGFRKVQV